MRTKRIGGGLLALIAAAGTITAPLSASAQNGSLAQQSHHRQKSKNMWRNIGIGSAGLGLLGFLKLGSPIGWAGMAGAAYSANRYEHDRHSQSKIDHERERR